MKLKRPYILAAVAFAVFAASTFGLYWFFSGYDIRVRGTVQETQIAGLTVYRWQPDPLPSQPVPLIVFSHGVRGCGNGAQYLMEALARHGYIVVAPNHHDSACGGVQTPQTAMEFFIKSELWSSKTYRDRGEDIYKLITALRQDPQWAAHIDWSKIGLLGYSLGGYTALSLAGAWPEWKLDGVKAVLAQAPYTTPLIEKGQLGKLGVPVMYQVALWDSYITDHVKQPGGAYDKTSPPAWFMELNKIDHDGFADVNPKDPRAAMRRDAHKDIVYYTIWFFDHALKGIQEPVKKRSNVLEWRSK